LKPDVDYLKLQMLALSARVLQFGYFGLGPHHLTCAIFMRRGCAQRDCLRMQADQRIGRWCRGTGAQGGQAKRRRRHAEATRQG